MSATAFQRRRRELKIKEKQLEEDKTLEEKEDLKSLKNDELKKLLDEKGIEYDSKAKKEDLIKLLEGAE